MDTLNGFPAILSIFYAAFHPTEGSKVYNQVPSGSVVPSFANNDSSALPEFLFDFNSVKNYIIPKPQLCNRLVSLKVGERRLVGYPVHIYSNEYQRNFFSFNFVFVFDAQSDIGLYEMSVRRLARMFMALEEQSKFLSTSRPVAFIDNILAQIFQDLNNYSECMVPIDESNSVNIKLFPMFPPPPTPNSYDVPISAVNLQNLIDENWDPTMEKIMPFIDGINSIRRIADLADADYYLTLQCIRHLIHYRCVVLTDLFQFSNIYAPTSDIALFLTDPSMFLECQAYVFSPPEKAKRAFSNLSNSGIAAFPSGQSQSHGSGSHQLSAAARRSSSSRGISGSQNLEGLDSNTSAPIAIANSHKSSSSVGVSSSASSFSTMKSARKLSQLLPTQAQLFNLYAKLQQCLTVKEWVLQNKKQLTCIDVRRFISFGIIKGIIYRVHSYPILDTSRGRKANFDHASVSIPAGRAKEQSRPRYSYGSDSQVAIDNLVRDIVRQPKHFDAICTELRMSRKQVEELLMTKGDWTIVSA